MLQRSGVEHTTLDRKLGRLPYMNAGNYSVMKANESLSRVVSSQGYCQEITYQEKKLQFQIK